MSRLKLTRAQLFEAVGPGHDAIVQFQNLFQTTGGLSEGYIWIGDSSDAPAEQLVSGDITLDLNGVALLVETANVITIVDAIVSDSASSILATQIFGA